MNDSIWRKAGVMPAFSSLRGALRTDVLVIGGGLTGILCALLLHKAGGWTAP